MTALSMMPSSCAGHKLQTSILPSRSQVFRGIHLRKRVFQNDVLASVNSMPSRIRRDNFSLTCRASGEQRSVERAPGASADHKQEEQSHPVIKLFKKAVQGAAVSALALALVSFVL